MPIVGTGLDAVEVARIRRLLGTHGERFVARLFTAGEKAYCERNADPAMHYAARFAAKEAAAKALGTGLAEGINWADIEVAREESGRPVLRLHGGALQRAQALGAERFHLSLTHTRELALAQVLLESA